jgi:DNA-binding Lrp family transcriptional regulator
LDFSILLALKNDPLMSLNELAEKIGVTWITAKTHCTHLKEKGVIRDPIAIYQPLILGLQRIVVLAKVPNKETLKMVEKGCDEHPYTRYRVRTLGGAFGIYIQFDIPFGTVELLNKFLLQLEKLGYLYEYSLHETIGNHLETYPDLTRYDSKSNTWNFNWEEWFKNIENTSNQILEESPSPNDFSTFKKSHFHILRELTKNASVTQKELREKYNLSRTETHRQYNYVLNHYIDRVRLIYKREMFNITETHLILCTDVDPTVQAQVYNLLKKYPPPFHSAMDIFKGRNFQLWVNTNPSQAIALANSVWTLFPKSKLYILNVRESGSFSYWFYPPNFNFETKDWRKDMEYMVKAPLDALDRIRTE